MFEGNNNEGNTPSMAEEVSNFLAEDVATLRERVAELERELAGSQNSIRFLGAQLTKWSNTWEAVRSRLADFHSEEEFSEGTAFGDYLIEEFNIQTEEEVKVTVTLTYSGTVTVKKGADLDDLEILKAPYDFNVELDGDTVGNVTLDDTEFNY